MSQTDLIELMRRHVHEADQRSNAAHSLWSWLPSQASAEKHLGDYACNLQPWDADLMKEASMLMSQLRGYAHSRAEIVSWFYCCTDDLEEPPQEDEMLAFVKAWFEKRGWGLNIEVPDARS